MGFPNVIYGSEERIFDDLTTERVPVGSKMVIEDGRIFRFTEAANAALVVNNMNEGAVPSTDTIDEAVGTISAGARVLTAVNSTSSSPAIDLMKFGYVHTTNATTLPLMRIKSNTLITASGNSGTITLFHPTPTDIASGNKISYYENPWRDVLVFAVTPVSVPVGICKVALSANQYGWLQTAGPATWTYDSTTTAINSVGDPVSISTNTAGSCMGSAAADTIPIMAIQMGGIEDTTDAFCVYLTLE
jgi:hypothetical protein